MVKMTSNKQTIFIDEKKKKINPGFWIFLISLFILATIIFINLKTTPYNLSRGISLDDMKALGNLGTIDSIFMVKGEPIFIPPGETFFQKIVTPEGVFYIPILGGTFANPGDFVGGLGQFNQDKFIEELIKELTKMNTSKTNKMIVTMVKMGGLPIMFISYIVNYVLLSTSTGGINQIIFGQQEWSVENIPAAFWVVCISIPLVIIIILIFQIISLVGLDNKRTLGQKLGDIAFGTFKTMIYIFIIPLGFWVLGVGLDIAITYISYISGTSDPNAKYFAFTDNIYQLLFFGMEPGASGSFMVRYPLMNVLWSGTPISKIPGLGGIISKIPGLGGLVTKADDNAIIAKLFTSWGFLGIAIGGATLLFIVTLFMSVIEKMFWLFINFIIAIYFACASTLDGGARMKSARDKIVSKTISIAVITLGINLALNVINGLNGVISFPPVEGKIGYVIYPLLKAVISIAVLLGIKKTAAEIESQIGESSNYSRIDSNAKSNIQSGNKLGQSALKTIKGAGAGPVGAVGGLTSSVIGGMV